MEVTESEVDNYFISVLCDSKLAVKMQTHES